MYGSKSGGKVGASLLILNGDAETKAPTLALPKHCIVRRAELSTNSRATDGIQKSEAPTFGIFGDSVAVLQEWGAALESGKGPNNDLCPNSYIKRSIRAAALDEWNLPYHTRALIERVLHAGEKYYAVQSLSVKVKCDSVIETLAENDRNFLTNCCTVLHTIVTKRNII